MIRKGNRIEVRDEGVSQGYAQSFDFVGTGVSVSVAGNVATVTVASGGAGADPPEGLYTPGSYTISTGKFRLAGKRQQFTTTQRLIVQGTGRLSIQN